MRNPIRLLSALASLLIGGLAVAPAAFADEPQGSRVRAFLDSALTDPGLNLEAPAALSLKSLQDEEELRADYRRAEYRRQPADSRPFFDFSRFELGGFLGVVAYTSDFEADPNGVFGIKGRLPVPGIPLGEWGIWADLFMGYIKRDLPFYYNHRSGNWYGLAVGGDYTLVRDRIWYLRGKVGVLYAHWNDIQALDNGLGLLAGVEIGFYWIRHNDKAVVTLAPEVSFDGDNAMMFLQLGFSVDF